MVVVCDGFGNRKLNSSTDIRLALEGNGQQVDGSVTDNGDGSYSCKYLVTVSGPYRCIISIDGTSLAPSPYDVNVEPAALDAASSYVCIDELSNTITAGEPGTIFVQPMDAHGNRVTATDHSIDAFLQLSSLLVCPSIGCLCLFDRATSIGRLPYIDSRHCQTGSNISGLRRRQGSDQLCSDKLRTIHSRDQNRWFGGSSLSMSDHCCQRCCNCWTFEAYGCTGLYCLVPPSRCV